MQFSAFDLIDRALQTRLDLRSYDPNIRLVTDYYYKCGHLWDGYQVPTSNPNGSLAGYNLVASTTPAMFGYSDYYELDEQVSVTESETGEMTQHWVILWCGELYNAYVSSARMRMWCRF